LFPLIEDVHQEDDFGFRDVQVDHSDSTTLSLAPSGIGDAEFPQAATSGHHIASIGIIVEHALKRRKSIVGQVLPDPLRELKRFYEECLYRREFYPTGWDSSS